MTKQDLYAECLNLTPDARPAFLKLYGLTNEGFWRYNSNRTPSRHKTRAAILATQDYRCALCKELATARVCLDKTGQVVCGRCNQLLAAWRPAVARGVTEAALVEFESTRADSEQSPTQPLPETDK